MDYLPVNNIDPNSDKVNLIVRGEKNEEFDVKEFSTNPKTMMLN